VRLVAAAGQFTSAGLASFRPASFGRVGQRPVQLDFVMAANHSIEPMAHLGFGGFWSAAFLGRLRKLAVIPEDPSGPPPRQLYHLPDQAHGMPTTQCNPSADVTW
jgi:hypothetical protein